MRFEDALISRTAEPWNDDEVMITEVWNLNHPSCPFVRYSEVGPQPPYWRAIQMSKKKWDQFCAEEKSK